jgi:hypothetical protein
MKTAAPSNWHTIIDARSRELHTIIAGKIRLNPSLIGQVRETLTRWLRAMDEIDRSREALVEWQCKLEDQPLDEVLEFMASEDEEACRLRQSSPFVDLLTEQERLDVFRKYEAFRS